MRNAGTDATGNAGTDATLALGLGFAAGFAGEEGAGPERQSRSGSKETLNSRPEGLLSPRRGSGLTPFAPGAYGVRGHTTHSIAFGLRPGLSGVSSRPEGSRQSRRPARPTEPTRAEAPAGHEPTPRRPLALDPPVLQGRPDVDQAAPRNQTPPQAKRRLRPPRPAERARPRPPSPRPRPPPTRQPPPHPLTPGFCARENAGRHARIKAPDPFLLDGKHIAFSRL